MTTIKDLIERKTRERNAAAITYNSLSEALDNLRSKDRYDVRKEAELLAQRGTAEAQVKELDATIARYEAEAKADAEINARSEQVVDPGTQRYNGRAGAETGRGYLRIKGVATSIARTAGDLSLRAFLATGSTVIPPEVLTESPVGMGKPATGLLDVLPVRTVRGGVYSYLRQTTRTNNAAPVARGSAKTASVMTLTRINGELNVVAHISEPIHEYDLRDAPNLEQFIDVEMEYGIKAALEDQILNGNGTAPQLNGLIATGTGTQAYATSPLVTIRTALAQLEAAGMAGAAIVLASADWLAIETATVTGGAFLLGQAQTGAPLDAIKRTLWGVPVVVSTEHTAGTAVVVAEGAAGLVADADGIDFRFGYVTDGFSKNQIVARSEGRFEVEVYRPTGIIVADLTA